MYNICLRYIFNYLYAYVSSSTYMDKYHKISLHRTRSYGEIKSTCPLLDELFLCPYWHLGQCCHYWSSLEELRWWEERKREPSISSTLYYLISVDILLVFSAPARTWSLYSLIPPWPNIQCEFEVKRIMVVLLIAQQSYLIVRGSIILIWWTPLKNRSSSNRLSSCSKEWVGFSCWWVVVGFRSKNMVTMKPVWLVEIVPMRPCTKPSSLVTNQ